MKSSHENVCVCGWVGERVSVHEYYLLLSP